MKAVIIGAGRIAVGFDKPGDRMVLTHAHAFTRARGVELLGVFDVDATSARQGAALWGCQAWTDFEDMMARCKPDIVSVCAPDRFHGQYLRELLRHRPKAVLAEKPLTTSLEESAVLVRDYLANGVMCNVNYIRRFNPWLVRLRQDFLGGKLGRALAVQAVYGKGLLHNGSHLVDFLRWFFGEPTSFSTGFGVLDAGAEDPSVAFDLECERCPEIHASVVDSREYTVFEIHLFFSNLKVSLTRGGLAAETTEVAADPVFAGYRDLIVPRRKKTGLENSMSHYLADTLSALKRQTEPACPIGDAYKTQELCTALVADWRNKNG